MTDAARFIAYTVGVPVALYYGSAGVYAIGARLVERRRSAKAKQRMIADYAEMVRQDLAPFNAEFEAWLERQVAG